MDIRGAQKSTRFMLWIDAVGGYWVCLGDVVSIGQGGACGGTDVAILADIARRHACIRRDGEGYVLEANRDAWVDGKAVETAAGLVDGSRIELGRGLKLAFRRPHALSATARFEFLSGHRTQPSADAVLLMAEACVLGPGAQCHVVCRDWPGEVILFQQNGELYCRTKGALVIDGTAYRDCGPLRFDSRVAGEGFSFSLETL